MNIRDLRSQAIKLAGERCQICRAAQGSYGYFIYTEHSAPRFKAFCRTDRSLVFEVLRDLDIKNRLTTIELNPYVVSDTNDLNGLKAGDIIAACGNCAVRNGCM